MELIRKLEKRLAINGKRYEVWAIFLCSFDNRLVEKRLYQGLRDKSCGCQFHSKEHNKKIGKANEGRRMSEETVEKTRQAKIGKKHTEEHKQKIREALIGKNIGKIQTEKTRQKISSSLKGKFLGENNANWNNGSSFLPYSSEFNKKLKQSILERDNYTCQCPDCEHKTDLLDIHHIDYNKLNNNTENLITLCDSCHAKTNSKNNRNFWINFYLEKQFHVYKGG